MESGLSSCLYECRVTHCRLKPRIHRFSYQFFLFYLDLDEVETLSRRLHFLSWNRFNLFNFRDADHFQADPGSVREKLTGYLRHQGVELGQGRAFLLTHLRTLGYLFNPVSFYFCFSDDGRPLCVVPEVSNTFGEMKPYFLGREDLAATNVFVRRVAKHFYVSPFVDLDVEFEFHLTVPGDSLSIRINDLGNGQQILLSTLQGLRRPLTNLQLAWFALKYPCITLWVIFSIHWQALRLYLKRVPWQRKREHPELQMGRVRPSVIEGSPPSGGRVEGGSSTAVR